MFVQGTSHIPSSERLVIANPVPSSTDWPKLSPLSTNESLYFMHIPKTAGTSLRIWMAQNFFAEDVLPNLPAGELVKLPKSEVDSKRFAMGHFGVSFAKHYRPPDRTVTWLRDPIQRTFSEYFYFKKELAQKDGYPRFASLPCVTTLEECLSDHEFSRVRANMQTTNLGSDCWDPARFYVAETQLLLDASSTLKQLEFFGITERMQISIDMLTWRLGWRPILFDIYENRTARTHEISEACHSLASNMNGLDLQLYEFAYRHFEHRFHEYLADVARVSEEQGLDIPSLHALQMDEYDAIRASLEPCFWNQYFHATRKEPRERCFTYSFDMPLRGKGWSERENISSMVSLPFRWMNQPTASIDLPLRRDVRLKIRIHLAHTLGQELRLYVDRAPIELQPSSAWNRFGVQEVYYQGELPIAGNWETQLTTLSFEVSKVLRPCDLNPDSSDDRQLGVAVDWISINP